MEQLIEALKNLSVALSRLEKSTSDIVDCAKDTLLYGKRSFQVCSVHGCWEWGLYPDQDGDYFCQAHKDLRTPTKGLDSLTQPIIKHD